MLTKLYEWLRIVNPKPTDEMVEKRKAAITDIISHILAQKDFSLLIALVGAAVHGNHALSQESPLFTVALEAIKKYQPAFPEALSENMLEVRTCCAVAVSELVNRNEAKSHKHRMLASSLVISSHPSYVTLKQRYLLQMLQELHNSAHSMLETTAMVRRRRTSVSLDPKLEGITDVQSLAVTLVPALKKALDDLQRQSSLEREEIEVLWWMFARSSKTLQSPLNELDAFDAALCCGIELANLSLLPPISSYRNMVSRALSEAHSDHAFKAVSLSKLTAKWDDKLFSLLIPSTPDAQDHVRNYPQLFPLSWLCHRFESSKSRSGWEEELKNKTSTLGTLSMPLNDWAIQVYNERIAQRCLLGN